MVMCYVPKPQLGVIYHTNKGIESSIDLEGKTLGSVPGSGEFMLFPAFCKKNGVAIDNIKIEQVSYGVLHGMFFEGKLDGIITFMPYLPRFKADGHKVTGFQYEDYGIYFNGVCATEKFLTENPVTVRRFIHASQKAFDWIYEHPKESVDIFFKAQPALKSYIERILRSSQKRPHLSKILINEMNRGATVAIPFFRNLKTETTFRKLKERFESWKADDKIRPIDPVQYILLLWAAQHFYAAFEPEIAYIMGRKKLRDEDWNNIIKQVKKIFLDILEK